MNLVKIYDIDTNRELRKYKDGNIPQVGEFCIIDSEKYETIKIEWDYNNVIIEDSYTNVTAIVWLRRLEQ